MLIEKRPDLRVFFTSGIRPERRNEAKHFGGQLVTSFRNHTTRANLAQKVRRGLEVQQTLGMGPVG